MTTSCFSDKDSPIPESPSSNRENQEKGKIGGRKDATWVNSGTERESGITNGILIFISHPGNCDGGIRQYAVDQIASLSRGGGGGRLRGETKF